MPTLDVRKKIYERAWCMPNRKLILNRCYLHLNIITVFNVFCIHLITGFDISKLKVT